MPALLLIAHAPLASSPKAVAGHVYPDCSRRLVALDVAPGANPDDVEAEARALALARDNLASARVPVGLHWHDVTRGLSQTYDVVISNPPFHQGRADEPALGLAFIAAAREALRPGGRLWLVANRHLPYEAALAKGFTQVRTVRDDAGFKVIEAIKETRQ